MGSLDGQIVIVTGASAGIGEATAKMLALEGATVVITARRRERLDQVRDEIRKAGGQAHSVPGDVTSVADRQQLIQETTQTFGRVDALINNAGYGQRGPVEIVPIDIIRQNFETNVFSLIALTQLVIPIMRKQGSGRIVNISSVAGRIARPLSSIYDATKHALEAFSDGLRGELAPFGIKVVVIEPGFIMTEFLDVANKASNPILDRDNPYTPFLGGIEEGAARLRSVAGVPRDMARLVLKPLASPRPKIRYAGPAHAKVFLALKRFLPDRLIDLVVAKQTGVTAEKLAAAGAGSAKPALGGN